MWYLLGIEYTHTHTHIYMCVCVYSIPSKYHAFIYLYIYIYIYIYIKLPHKLVSSKAEFNLGFNLEFYWLNNLSVRQWSGRPGFNPRSNHTNDSKMLLDTIYPTPPLGQDMTQGQFLSGV